MICLLPSSTLLLFLHSQILKFQFNLHFTRLMLSFLVSHFSASLLHAAIRDTKVDSAKGLTVELNQYDCYNSPAAPNRCDGERFGEIEKPGTNLFFIISCIVLGIICTTLIVSVLCYTGKVEEPSYNQDDAISKKENNLLLNSGKASSKTV
tara:strand:- start:174 stop:626 length:453 start_codon:yes stop_codon:yes gene_type:complete